MTESTVPPADIKSAFIEPELKRPNLNRSRKEPLNAHRHGRTACP